MGLLCAATALAHPIDEPYLRWEVQIFVLTRGLRLDLYVLHGGQAIQPVWRRYDPRGLLSLTPDAERRWGQALARQVRVELDGRPQPVEADLMVVPSYQALLSCNEPVVVRAPVRASPATGRPVTCRVRVQPDPDWPVYARLSYVAPQAVRLEAQQSEPGAASVVITWPAEGDPDTSLPQLTMPDWFFELPRNLSLEALPPTRPTDQTPVAAPPSATLRGSRDVWPAVLLLSLAGWSLARASRRRPAR